MTISRSIELSLALFRNFFRYHCRSYLITCKVKEPKSTKKYGKVNIICVKGATINLGENITLCSKQFGYHGGMPFGTTLLADESEAYISIGNNCRINGAYIHAKKEITIGDNCVFAAGVNVIDQNGHQLLSPNRTVGKDKAEAICIGDNVWLCVNSIILKGTTIGNNCVVAANSVVKGIFPDNCLIQGNPAVIVSRLPIQQKDI